MDASDLAPKESATILLKTEGCHVSILDRLSVANRAGEWNRAQASANDLRYWEDYQDRQEMLTGILLGDGVYRARLLLLPEEPPVQFTTPWNQWLVGAGETERMLNCSSGEILLISTYELGNAHSPVLTISPGTYRVGWKVDLASEDRHMFMENPEDYPETEGPDWVICFQRAA